MSESETWEDLVRKKIDEENERAKLKPPRSDDDYKAPLFWLIMGLTIFSFVFLVLVILLQMWWEGRHPDRQLVSDTVINVLAIGVFAELVGVVSIIARLLWKKEEK